mgnify:CR=1 FL=1
MRTTNAPSVSGSVAPVIRSTSSAENEPETRSPGQLGAWSIEIKQDALVATTSYEPSLTDDGLESWSHARAPPSGI